MLKIVNDLSDHFINYIKDDPVRPEIPIDFRIKDGRKNFVLTDDSQEPDAIVCVSFHNFVPTDVYDLQKIDNDPNVAIFYTIWSYKPGAGAKLLRQAVENLKEGYKGIQRFVTLSPKTELAKKFHLKNGAYILRENEQTINYEYI